MKLALMFFVLHALFLRRARRACATAGARPPLAKTTEPDPTERIILVCQHDQGYCACQCWVLREQSEEGSHIPKCN